MNEANSKKILIIEDERTLRYALALKFNHESFIAFTAKDGLEGLDVAIKEHPDLILLDLVMPILDGISTLTKLREDTWGKTVPVIVLTNLADGEQVMRAKANGANDYLIKTDWKLDDVVTKVKDKLLI